MVRVKICGITNWADARAACDAGAHALGFNFYEKSPRVIAPAVAWAIRKKLPPFVEAIGVFVNWTPAAIISLCGSLLLHAAQLHGDETPDVAAKVAHRVPVIQAFRVGEGFSLARLARYRAASAYLLDAAPQRARADQYGGTGRTTDWSLARRAARARPIILSGGLRPENVAAAILAVRPYAVDVASGVESRHGKKDLGKLREFIQEVHRAERELENSRKS